MNWKDFGSRLLGAIVGGLMAGLGTKAGGATWSAAGLSAATTAVGLVGYGGTHTTVQGQQS